MKRAISILAVAAALVVAPAGLAGRTPSGPTAQCTDGTYSYSAHRRGTCSHHGGVSIWLRRVPAIHRQAARCPYGCTVHVSGYTKKSRTYVAPYNRRPPRR